MMTRFALFHWLMIALVVLGLGWRAAGDELLRDPEPDTGPEDLDLHLHDPSRILWRGAAERVAVTGKEQSRRYDCGLEIWERSIEKTGEVGPWRQVACLLREKPAWIERYVPGNDGAYWAPDFVDADRILYSVGSNFEDGGPSALGLVVRQADGSWRDLGRAVAYTGRVDRQREEISVIDPAFFQSSDGRAYVVTGGGVIHIAEADLDKADLGLPKRFPGRGWRPLARGPVSEDDDLEHAWVEAAFMYERDDYFYLFVNWGACCMGAASTYEIRVGRARHPMGPFVDEAGRPMLRGGGRLVLEGVNWMRGPGHASIRKVGEGDAKDAGGGEVMSFHYYDARRGGLPWLGEVRLIWEKGWPKVIAYGEE